MSLKIEFDAAALRPLVQLAVAAALDRLEEERARFNGRRPWNQADERQEADR